MGGAQRSALHQRSIHLLQTARAAPAEHRNRGVLLEGPTLGGLRRWRKNPSLD